MRHKPYSPRHHHHRHELHAPPRGEPFFRHEHTGGGDLFGALAEKIVFAGVVTISAPFLIAKTLIERGIERSKIREMTEKMTAAGLPTPAQVTARFKTKRKKTLTQALELGAMLLALTPTLDALRVRATDGQLGGRGRGLKGWLTQYCPTVGYSSASRYRKLAERFLDYLQFEKTSASWTMSWILPDKPLPDTDDAETLAAIRQARSTVADLLRGYPSQRALHRLLAAELPSIAKPS
jgi:hypothetical protein